MDQLQWILELGKAGGFSGPTLVLFVLLIVVCVLLAYQNWIFFGRLKEITASWESSIEEKVNLFNKRVEEAKTQTKKAEEYGRELKTVITDTNEYIDKLQDEQANLIAKLRNQSQYSKDLRQIEKQTIRSIQKTTNVLDSLEKSNQQTQQQLRDIESRINKQLMRIENQN